MEESPPIFSIDKQSLRVSILCKETHSISRFQLGDFPSLVRYLLKVKVAAAYANLGCHKISNTIATRIVDSCLQLGHRANPELFIVDVMQGGGGFAINTNINEAIQIADAHAKHRDLPLSIDDINANQSSSDVCSTALRLALYEQGQLLEIELSALIASLSAFIASNGDVDTLARTCWQDAMVIRLADRFFGITEAFIRSKNKLTACFNDLLAVSLGSTVLGTGFGASEAYRNVVIDHLASVTKLNVVRQSSPVSIAQNFPDLSAVSLELKAFCQSLIRLGLDLRILNSGPKGGLSEITLPGIMQSSSFFSQKFNPTIVETAIQGGVYAHSLASSFDLYRIMPEIDLNVFEWAAGINLLLALEIVTSSLACLKRNAIDKMTANRTRCLNLTQFAHPTRGTHARTNPTCATNLDQTT